MWIFYYEFTEASIDGIASNELITIFSCLAAAGILWLLFTKWASSERG